MEAWFQNVLAEFGRLDATYVVRIIAALVLGGFIGLEREMRDKPAGFRTIILICVGACLFTILSQSILGEKTDRTRIAAQIVSGIGFLGAGAIIRGRDRMYGLTTAATIWAVASIGMAAGFGEIGLASVGTIMIVVVLFAFNPVEKWISHQRDVQKYVVKVLRSPKIVAKVCGFFEQHGLLIKHHSCHQDKEHVIVQLRVVGSKQNHDRVKEELLASDEYSIVRI